jgi:hypothetical protein
MWLLMWLGCSISHPEIQDEGTSPGECSNGIDDDEDGFIDCLDFDCDPDCDTGQLPPS